MSGPHIHIEVDGPIQEFLIEDVPLLQKYCKDNWELYVRATERLRKARRVRTDAVILLRKVVKCDDESKWGDEYGPDAARLLDQIRRFLKANPLEKHE